MARINIVCRVNYYKSYFFFFKHKTAYELRISDCSSYVCSSDLMLYMHSFRHENPLRVDIVQDLRAINTRAAFAKRTGMIVLGGGQIGRATCRERVCQYV